MAAGLITGMDIGVRDEAEPGPQRPGDRVFVADADAIRQKVQAAVAGFPFPWSSSRARSSPTTARAPTGGRGERLGRRGADRADGRVPGGDAGASPATAPGARRQRTTTSCVDPNRAPGTDRSSSRARAVRPRPGRPPRHARQLRVPTRTSPSGTTDAGACCTIDISVRRRSPTSGVHRHGARAVDPRGRQRGRTTGLTAGSVSGPGLSRAPRATRNMPSVAGAPPGSRIMTGRIHITPTRRWPCSPTAATPAPSSSTTRAARSPHLRQGIPPQATIAQRTAVATPIAEVEAALNVSFTWPIPILDAFARIARDARRRAR